MVGPCHWGEGVYEPLHGRGSHLSVASLGKHLLSLSVASLGKHLLSLKLMSQHDHWGDFHRAGKLETDHEDRDGVLCLLACSVRGCCGG